MKGTLNIWSMVVLSEFFSVVWTVIDSSSWPFLTRQTQLAGFLKLQNVILDHELIEIVDIEIIYTYFILFIITPLIL